MCVCMCGMGERGIEVFVVGVWYGGRAKERVGPTDFLFFVSVHGHVKNRLDPSFFFFFVIVGSPMTTGPPMAMSVPCPYDDDHANLLIEATHWLSGRKTRTQTPQGLNAYMSEDTPTVALIPLICCGTPFVCGRSGCWAVKGGEEGGSGGWVVAWLVG
jgi:hypothetical protein